MSVETLAGARATTTGSAGPTTPDWYPDPADPALLRWWSGAGWTEHTSPRVIAEVAPIPAAAESRPEESRSEASRLEESRAEATAPLTRRELRARELGAVTATSTGSTDLFGSAPTVARTPPAPQAGAAHTPAATGGTPDSGGGTARTPREPLSATYALRDETGFVDIATARTPMSVFTPLWPTRVHTFALWLIAVMPLGWAVAEHASGMLMTEADTMAIRAAAAAAFLLVTILCALRDAHLLRAGGHSDTASPWWTLLTPLAYLIVRTVRVRQETKVRATAAVWVWLLATLPLVALLSGIRDLDGLTAF